MNVKRTTCSNVRRDLLKLDQLTAVDRGILEIHLRRCPECHRIADEFSTIEMSSLPLEEVTAERQRDIYNRLVPAVHELTSEPPPPPPKGFGGTLEAAINSKPLLLLGTLALFALAVGLILTSWLSR